jgi:alkyl hydroperoxide reductase subunit AhpF
MYLLHLQEKMRKDKEMWQRLQKLHNVDASTLPSLEEVNEDDSKVVHLY